MEHQDYQECLAKVLCSDVPENEVQRFLGVFFESFGQYIVAKKARKGSKVGLEEALRIFGEQLFEEFLPIYRG